jgi:hypothetical protein
MSLLAIGDANIHSWPEWQALVVSYGLNGALIGVLVGLGQARILGPLQVPLLRWTFVTLVVYAIGLSVSVVLASAITFWTWPAELPMLTGDSTTFMWLDVLHIAPVAGAILGLGQWWVLRGYIGPTTRLGGLLWTLGNICGLGIGGFLARIISGLTWLGYFSYPVGRLTERAVVGAILGFITGAILVILRQSAIHADDRHSTVKNAPQVG